MQLELLFDASSNRNRFVVSGLSSVVVSAHYFTVLVFFCQKGSLIKSTINYSKLTQNYAFKNNYSWDLLNNPQFCLCSLLQQIKQQTLSNK